MTELFFNVDFFCHHSKIVNLRAFWPPPQVSNPLEFNTSQRLGHNVGIVPLGRNVTHTNYSLLDALRYVLEAYINVFSAPTA